MAKWCNMSTLVAAAMVIQLLINSVSATPTHVDFIESICERVQDKAFCMKTLTSSPTTATPTGLFPLAEAVINLGLAHAEKTAAFADETAKKEVNLKTQFEASHKAYLSVVAALKGAITKLKGSPDTANYDVEASRDHTRRVMELIGKNTDKSSTTLMEMTVQMDKFLALAAGATDAVDDDDENLFRRV